MKGNILEAVEQHVGHTHDKKSLQSYTGATCAAKGEQMEAVAIQEGGVQTTDRRDYS